MQNVNTLPLVTESFATDLIFNACRANEHRCDWTDGKYSVKFIMCKDGTYEAVLKNVDGINIATANVDQFDV